MNPGHISFITQRASFGMRARGSRKTLVSKRKEFAGSSNITTGGQGESYRNVGRRNSSDTGVGNGGRINAARREADSSPSASKPVDEDFSKIVLSKGLVLDSRFPGLVPFDLGKRPEGASCLWSFDPMRSLLRKPTRRMRILSFVGEQETKIENPGYPTTKKPCGFPHGF